MAAVIHSQHSQSGSQSFSQRSIDPGAVAGGVGQMQQRPLSPPVQVMKVPLHSGKRMIGRQDSASLYHIPKINPLTLWNYRS